MPSAPASMADCQPHGVGPVKAFGIQFGSHFFESRFRLCRRERGAARGHARSRVCLASVAFAIRGAAARPPSRRARVAQFVDGVPVARVSAGSRSGASGAPGSRVLRAAAVPSSISGGNAARGHRAVAGLSVGHRRACIAASERLCRPRRSATIRREARQPLHPP
jgi:hypothetical protein